MLDVLLSLDKVSYFEKPDKREIKNLQKRLGEEETVISIQDVAKLIGEQGCTFCPAIFYGYRKKELFKAMQLFALDFDDGTPYSVIRNRAKEYGLPICFSYHTFSSTKDKPKFRIIFLHDCPVNNCEIVEAMIAMLMKIFPKCDKSCSDASRMFFGGKGLIEYYEQSFKLTELVEVFQKYMKLNDTSNHYVRSMKNFAKKYKISVGTKGELQIYDIKDIKNGVKYDKDNYTLIGMSENTPIFDKDMTISLEVKYLVYRSYEQEKEKTSLEYYGNDSGGDKKKRKLESIKYASECCKLYKEFIEGMDVEHSGRFHLLLFLIKIRGGKRIFLDTIKNYGYDLEKWKKEWNYAEKRGYKHEQSCQKCIYCDECNHNGTIIKTIEQYKEIKERTIKHLREEGERISLEEGRRRLKENIKSCIDSDVNISLIKAQTGIGKSFTYLQLISEEYLNKKFVVALPNNSMKMEIGKEFKKRGLKEPELFITPSHRDYDFPSQVGELIQELYDKGIYNQSAIVVKRYLEEHQEELYPDEIRKLEEFLSMNHQIQDSNTRVIVTTHTKLSNMPSSLLKDYIVIIDEDILTLCYFLQKREIEEDIIEYALGNIKFCTEARAFLEELLQMEKNEIKKLKKQNYQQWLLDDTTLNESGIEGNINDIFKAETILKKDGVLHYYYGGKLPQSKCIILSATLDEEIYKKYFKLKDSQIEYIEEPLVEYTGKIIQYNYYFLGRKFLEEEAIENIKNQMKTEFGYCFPIITFKKFQNDRDTVDDIYYGKCSGSNQLCGQNIACVGTPFCNEICYKLVAKYMTDIKENDMQFPHRIIYDGMEFYHMAYSDPFLCRLQCYWTKSDLEQAVGRARVISKGSTVVVFASFPCEQAEYRIENYLSDSNIVEEVEE